MFFWFFAHIYNRQCLLIFTDLLSTISWWHANAKLNKIKISSVDIGEVHAITWLFAI